MSSTWKQKLKGGYDRIKMQMPEEKVEPRNLQETLGYEYIKLEVEQEIVEAMKLQESTGYECINHQEEALALLLASTTLTPERNPFKWLCLAQLQVLIHEYILSEHL